MTNDLSNTAASCGVEIRIANRNDETRFMEMRLECLRAVYGLQKDFGFSDELVARSQAFFRSGDHATVFAFDGNENCLGVASICFINVMPTFEHPSGKRAHLMNVYVRTEFRRRGIARDMISRLVNEARARGITEVTLDATDEGRLLYESLGFESNKEAMALVLR